MAKIQIKRSSLSGNAPNTSNIETGELALNITDGKLYSTNGTSVFEIGANLSSLQVNGIAYPTSDGSNGQVLTTDGNGTLTFTTITGGGGSDAVQQLETYTFSITGNVTVIEGADDSNNNFQYTTGEETVFLNGIKLVSGSDYTTTNATAITLAENAQDTDVIQINTFEGTSRFLTNTTSTSNTSIQPIDGFQISAYRSAKFTITCNTATAYMAVEALVIHDDTTAYLNEYGAVQSNGNLVNLSCDISDGSVRLLAEPVNAGTTFKTKKLLTKV
jgi:hypothetical protein